MKKILLICILFFCYYGLHTQNHLKIDSLQNRLLYAKADTSKIVCLYEIALQYQQFNSDTTLLYSLRAYKKSLHINYLDGISRSATIIGNVYLNAGNYAKALEYYIEKLKTEEKRNKPEIQTTAIMQIATTYQLESEYDKASSYALRADSIIDTNKLSRLKLYSLLNLGDLFEKSDNLSLAMKYTQDAYNLSIKDNDKKLRGVILNNLGNIYAKSGNTELAIQNYKNAIPLLVAESDEPAIAENSLGLAKQYLRINTLDSALSYAKKSYDLSKKNGFLSKQLDACIFLVKYYKDNNDINHAFSYQEEELMLKDSIYSKDRITRSQLLTIEEELRQKEIAEKKIEEAHDRKIKLQYLTIAILLPIFFFITIYLSNRKIRPKYIEFLGIISLLLTFEYIMIILHPLIVSITHHLPLYQLLIFAVIASILTPLHHRIENWLVKVLTKKEEFSLMNIRIQ
jgi:hypothetical protein